MPAANNTPGFVSFNDYLNANAGSLDTERNANLAGAQGAVDKVGADYAGLAQAAYGQGNAAGTAANPGFQTYDSNQTDWTSYDPGSGTTQHTGNHGAGSTPNARPTAGYFDPSTLSGYQGAIDDTTAARQAVSSLTAPAAGHNAFETGLLGADSGYQGKAAALGDQLNGGLSGYLDNITGQYKSGFNAGVAPTPAPTFTPEQRADAGQGGPGRPRRDLTPKDEYP